MFETLYSDGKKLSERLTGPSDAAVLQRWEYEVGTEMRADGGYQNHEGQSNMDSNPKVVMGKH